MSTALVTGATGINGRAIIDRLSDPSLASHQWTKIYAVARHLDTTSYPPSVHALPLDLLSSPAHLAQQLTAAAVPSIDYVFFAAYIEEATEEAACATNGALLSNLLLALRAAGLEAGLKRVVLTTGCKEYGVHLGPVKVPMEETDARLAGRHGWPPLFYDVQEDILAAESAGRGWDWVVVRPNDIIGLAEGNFMNLSTALAVYCAIHAHMRAPCYFPGSEAFYTSFDTHSYAPQIAEFEEWAAHTPGCGREAFNMVTGDAASYMGLWPKMCAYFGAALPDVQFTDELMKAEGAGSFALHEVSPLAADAAALGLKGSKSAALKGEIGFQVELAKWAGREEVKRAWGEMVGKYGLKEEAFGKATWSFVNFVLGRNFHITVSMSKARKMGWTGYKDTWEAFEETFEGLKKAKVVPQ